MAGNIRNSPQRSPAPGRRALRRTSKTSGEIPLQRRPPFCTRTANAMRPALSWRTRLQPYLGQSNIQSIVPLYRPRASRFCSNAAASPRCCRTPSLHVLRSVAPVTPPPTLDRPPRSSPANFSVLDWSGFEVLEAGPRSDLLTLSPGQSNERAAQRSDKTKRNSRFGQQHADCAFSP